MASESCSHLLPFNTLIHMITIKLSSSNYLFFWKNQLLLLLENQDMLSYVDGTLVSLLHFKQETSSTLCTKYLALKAANQRLLCLPLFSLTEVSPLHMTFGSRWRLHSATVRKIVNWDSRMTCNLWNATPNLLLSKPAHSKQSMTNFMPLVDPLRILINFASSFVDEEPLFFFFFNIFLKLFLLLEWRSVFSSLLQI